MSLTYWKAVWPFIVFILATGSRLVQYLLHARSWSNYLAKALWLSWGSCEFPNSTQYQGFWRSVRAGRPSNDEALTLFSDVNGRMRTTWTEGGWGRKEAIQVCSYLCIPSWCLQGRCCWCRGPASGGPGSRTRPEGSRTQGAAECEITLIRIFKGAVWRSKLLLLLLLLIFLLKWLWPLPSCSFGVPGP